MLQSGLTRAGSALKGSCSRKTGEACCSEAESEGPPRIGSNIVLSADARNIDRYSGPISRKVDAAMASQMHASDHEPGEPTPRTGDYEQLNQLGAPTNWSIYARKGEPLPHLPLGYKWRYVSAEPD